MFPETSGIPKHVSVKRLLYNRPSNCLVLVGNRDMTAGVPLGRLFYRPAQGGPYAPIPVADPFDSQADAMTCEAAPYVLYNLIRYDALPSGDIAYHGEWLGIERFDLSTGRTELVLGEGKLRLAPDDVHGSISKLIAPWPDGSGMTCTLGLRKRVYEKSPFEHWICDVSFVDGAIKQIALLPWTFA